MYLKQLHLQQFRNYRQQQVEFVAPKTILVGNNAQGKTNLLEAVALLSTLRSNRASSDRDLIYNDADTAQITGTVDRIAGTSELSIFLRSSGRRTVTLNSEPCRRQLDFLGTLNLVQFSSLDLDLVRGAPENRRRWLDGLLIQLEPVYAYIWRQYNQVLRQRNALLRQIKKAAARGKAIAPPGTLAVLDVQLATLGVRVVRRRWRALRRLVPLAQHWHSEISGRAERLQIDYTPNLQGADEETIDRDPEAMRQGFLAQIQLKAEIERYQGTSLVGPHRDEVMLTIDNTPVRQYGSQGQQRTLVLALKLSELELIEDVVGEPPLLLLDDVLAELDPDRQNQLLAAIEDRFQTLVTATHLGAFDDRWRRSSQILQVNAGAICE